MRIPGQDTVNIISKPQTETVFDAAKPGAPAGRTAPGQTSSSDKIELGSQSGLLSQAQTAGANGTDARIEQLRALVQSGQYEVDSQALSQSIVTGASSGY